MRLLPFRRLVVRRVELHVVPVGRLDAKQVMHEVVVAVVFLRQDAHAVILTRDWEEAAGITDRLAPEHLQVMVPDAEALFARVRHAGAAFLGAHCPEAVGDYVAGPNHVLPTGRTARFASGLSVFDFLKRTTWVAADAEALGRVGPAAVALAEAEGLQAHARSVALRLGQSGPGPGRGPRGDRDGPGTPAETGART